MTENDWERELKEALRRAEEARQNWHQARDEMRQTIWRVKEERRRAGVQGRMPGEDLHQSLEEVMTTAQAFADEVTEVADEARSLAGGLVSKAKQEWQARWRDDWRKSFGKEGQFHWVFGGRRFRQWSTGSEEANPFVASFMSRGAGLLSVYVLHLLAEQPRHGSDIMRQIEQRTLGSCTSNPAAIYPLLSFMEEKGFVRSRWEDPDKRTRRIYQITEEGRAELGRLRTILQPKVMEAIEVLHTLYDELYEDGVPQPIAGALQDGRESQASE